MAASSTTINFSSTSLKGHTGATTPTTFSDTMNTAATVVAILTAGHTTITAFQVESTTGLAVVDGTTLTWRHEGITLSKGDVVSLGFNGLEDSTTTAMYQAVTLSSSVTVPSSTTVVVTKGSTTLTSTKGVHHHTGGGSPTTKTPTGTAGAASTSSSGIAPTMGAGKALALLGALGGMVAYGL